MSYFLNKESGFWILKFPLKLLIKINFVIEIRNCYTNVERQVFFLCFSIKRQDSIHNKIDDLTYHSHIFN